MSSALAIARDRTAVCCTAGLLLAGSPLPAHAAGDWAMDVAWPVRVAFALFLLSPLVVVGLLLAVKLRLGPMIALVSACWMIAWWWLAHEKGLHGALERTGAALAMLAIFTLPVVVGWLLGRSRRRSPAHAHSIANGN